MSRGSAAKQLEGKLIGARFRVTSELGSGGMGAVYEAEDTVLGRPVALKLLHVDSDEHAARLEREARAASRIADPGVAIVHDVGQDPEVGLYLVMERMRGRTLEEMTADGTPLELPRIVDIGRRVVAALEAAHGAGVVHRDLKPANIFMLDKGGLKVMDFGIAKIVKGSKSDTDTLTDVESIVGTPAYIAPEAVRKGDVGPAADIYALGIILFELVTGGRRPFESDDPVMLCAAHLKERPPKVSDLTSESVPAELVSLIDQMLKKQPGKRPSLHQIDASLARLAGGSGPAPTWRLPWVAGAVATLVLVAVAVVLTREDPAEGDPVPEGATAPDEVETQPRIPTDPVEVAAPPITIEVVTDPSDATLHWDGDEVRSPFVVLADHTTHTLQVAARGHDDETLSIVTDQSRRIDVHLRPSRVVRMSMSMATKRVDPEPVPW